MDDATCTTADGACGRRPDRRPPGHAVDRPGDGTSIAQHAGWLVIVVSAVAAATLTVTASGAETRAPEEQQDPFRAAADVSVDSEDPPDAGGVGDDAAGIVRYRFEARDADRGWSADGAADVLLDTAVVWDGERSLGLVVGEGASGAISLRGSLDALARRPEFALEGAGLRCHVRPRGLPAGAEVLAAAVVAGSGGGMDRGEVVPLTDGAWTTVSMVVGRRGEPAPEGWTDVGSGDVDTDAVTALGIDVQAERGALPSAVNIDGCVVRSEPEPDVVPAGRAPLAIDAGGSGATTAVPRERTTTPRDGGRSTPGRPAASPTPEPPGAPEPVTFDFESSEALRTWTTDGTAGLAVDAAVSHRGRRSLRLVSEAPAGAAVTLRAALPPDGRERGRRLTGAHVSCQVLLADGQGVVGPVTGSALVQDATGQVELGQPVALRSGRWRAVATTVGGTATGQGSPAVDGDAVVAIGLVVQAEEDVALQLHVDDCQILPGRGSTSM